MAEEDCKSKRTEEEEDKEFMKKERKYQHAKYVDALFCLHFGESLPTNFAVLEQEFTLACIRKWRM